MPIRRRGTNPLRERTRWRAEALIRWHERVDRRDPAATRAWRLHVLAKIVNGHLSSQIDNLPPWAYAKTEPLKAVA